MMPRQPDTQPLPTHRLGRAGTIALALFLLITVAMAMGLFGNLDQDLLRAFRTEDPALALGGRSLLQAMRDITALGGAMVLSLVTLCAAAALLRSGRGRLAGFLIASNLLAQGASWGLKHVFDRPRPQIVPHLVEAFGASYPSGHALMSSAIWLTLAGLAAMIWPGRGWWLAPIAAGLLVAAIGISRIYLGVHWPSDVSGGWAFGSFWACASLALARRLGLV